MQGTSLTKQERECKLYDAFDKFTHIKGESLHTYYLRFTQLINDMNIYKMKMEQFQVNTKFLNSLFHLNGVAYQSPQAPTQLITESLFVDSGFAVLVFAPGDDLIACLNKAMAFLTAVASVTVQQVQGRQGQSYSGNTYKSSATSSRGNTTSGQARVVKCYNCQDPGIPASQTQTVIPHNAAFQTEDLDTYDSDCDDLSSVQAVLMANISNYGSDVISEVFKDQFDSIKRIRVRHKEQSDSLINKLNLKSVENKDLKAQIQNKGSSHSYLRNTQEQANILREIVKQAKVKQPLDSELVLACKYATRIQELLVYVQDTCPNAITPSAKKVTVKPMNNVKKVRFAEPLTSSSNIKQVESSNTSDSNTPVLSSTGVKCSTSNCGSKPPGNKKNDRISQTPSRNKKNKVEAQPRKVNKMNRVVKPVCDVDVKQSLSNANSDILCATCNKSMFDGVHDKCLLDLVQNGNNRTKSAKKHKKQNIWKSTSHVFTKVGFKWKPTSRTFTIIGNSCPLTRFTSTNVVPPKQTTSHSDDIQKPELKVYSRKPKSVKNIGCPDCTLICPRVPGRDFDALPSEEDTISFLRDLSHTGVINSLNDVVIDQMHQPWRTFAAIINRSLSGKTSGLDKLREVPPKVARKFKKASPSKKEKSLPWKQSQKERKKEKVDIAHGKGIELLSEVALSEKAQMKEVRKKSLRDFHKTHPSGSGTVSEKPPSVEKITPTVTSEGTDDKPGVPDVINDDSSKSESEPWGNDEDKSNNEQESSDESSKQENESEEQESNSEQDEESDDDDQEEEEFDQENKYEDDEMKSDEEQGMDDTTDQFDDDANARLEEPTETATGIIQGEGNDAEMTEAQQGNENLETTQEQVVEDAHVTISIVPKKT
ncbi:hypothetical protein Tco_1237735 [Tanacetum coccineum]